MKTKKGLGSIPKSLSWIDAVEEKTIHETAKEVPVEVHSKQEPEHESVSTVFAQPTKSTQKGLPSGWIRATFIVDQKLNENMKALAYWERLTVKEVMHEALTQYMQDKNVKPIPKKKTNI